MASWTVKLAPFFNTLPDIYITDFWTANNFFPLGSPVPVKEIGSLSALKSHIFPDAPSLYYGKIVLRLEYVLAWRHQNPGVRISFSELAHCIFQYFLNKNSFILFIDIFINLSYIPSLTTIRGYFSNFEGTSRKYWLFHDFGVAAKMSATELR